MSVIVAGTNTRTDTLTTNATISEINNLTYASGNVSLFGETNKTAFNISSNNVYVVSLTESTNIQGIANDGTYVYVNDAGSRIKKALFNGSVVSSHTVSSLPTNNNDMAHNGRFLYVRNGNTIYLINLTSNTSAAVSVDSSKPIPDGRGWLSGNIVDMPDRRMGVISDSGTNPIILRLYNVSENGTYWSWSQDFNIATSWATDNHGIVSDGDSLVLISHLEGHRIFSLVNLNLQSQDSWDMRPSGIGNPTFITYDHVGKRVLIGDYNDREFAVYNGSYSTGNFTSTTTETTATILNITNVTWNSYGDTLGSTIRLQVSPNNGTTWYQATNGEGITIPLTTGNNSLKYRVMFTTSSGANLTISNITIQWIEDSLSITINNPTNTTYNNSTITFNISLNEDGSAWASLNNGTNNVTLTSTNNRDYNYTNTSIGDGSYTLIIYANSTNPAHNGTTTKTVNFTIYTSDNDNDGILDNNDTLVGRESSVNISGINNLNITISGSATNGTFTGTKEVLFKEGSQIMINFTHNFSSGNIDLRNVRIQKSDNYLIINLSGQLQGNKTVFVNNNNFVHLCIKDSDIASINEISTSCDASGEINFDNCLGANQTTSGISCIDNGTTIRIDNLTHSAIRGSQATSTAQVTTYGGSGGGVCTNTWVCSSWSYCNAQFKQERICELKNKNSCTPQGQKPQEERICPSILFDVEVDILNKKLLPWNKLMFTTKLREVNQTQLVDITIKYLIKNEERIMIEEEETIAIPGNLTLTKEMKNLGLRAGKYDLQVIIIYGREQTASAKQTFTIIAEKTMIYYSVGIIILLFLIWLSYHEWVIRKKEEKIIRYLRKNYRIKKRR